MTQNWTWDTLLAAFGTDDDLLDALLDADDRPAPLARFNICPSADAVIMRGVGVGPASRVDVSPVRWGLAKTPAQGRPGLVSNARAETVDRLPMFRGSFERRRCVVPASGFYEWQTLGDGSKQPWYFTPRDASLLFLAGVWSEGSDGPGFVTMTAPTPESAHTNIHHRTPCVVLPEHVSAWLGRVDHPGPRSCLRAFGSEHAFPFVAHPVSKRVNRAGSEGPALIEPFEPAPSLFG